MAFSIQPAILGPLCALSSSATWAMGSSGYSQLSQKYSPFSINFTRALISLPLFIISAVVVSGSISSGIDGYLSLQWSHLGWFTLSMIASYGLGDVFFLWSARSLGVPGALAIASSYPVLTTLGGYLFSDETTSIQQIFGLLLTVSGIVLVILYGPERSEVGKTTQKKKIPKKVPWTGVLLALLTSLGWATNGFAVSKCGASISPAVGNTVRMMIAMVLCLGFGRIFSPKAKVLLSKKDTARYLWLFILEAFGGSTFYFYGLSHSSLALGSTLSSLAPAFSVPVALLLGTEKFSIFRTLGVIFVVAGVSALLTS